MTRIPRPSLAVLCHAALAALLPACSAEIPNQLPPLANAAYYGGAYSMALPSAAGTSPAAVIGDATQDGVADAVIGGATAVNVYQGMGNGQFYPFPLTYAAGGAPSAIVMADFNGDHINDLAVAIAGSTVSVLLGSATGGFAAATSVAVASTPMKVRVADVNADGNLDLITANAGAATLSVALGNGSGGFAAAVAPAAGITQADLCLADFDGDGVPDAAVVASSGAIAVLKGTPGATPFFAAGTASVTVSATASGIVCGDFDRDGLADVAVLTNNGGALPATVDILFGKGDRTFRLPKPAFFFQAAGVNLLSANANLLEADVNRDGIPDLIVADKGVASTTDGAIATLIGNGDGTFQTVHYSPAGLSVVGLALGDLNGDGVPDLLALPASAANFSVLLGF